MTSASPLISIILPVFNSADYLTGILENISAQTYQRKELIVIDGGSTDGSLVILKKWADKIAYFVSEKDKGVYDAMNKGIAAAKGDWLYFLGTDDLLAHPNILLELFGGQAGEEAVFLYGNARFRSGNAVYGGSRTYRELMVKNICHQAIFYHKTIFKSFGGFDLRYPVLADHDLNLRIFEDINTRKKYIEKDICIYNNRGGLSSITIDGNFFRDWLNRCLNEKKMRADDPVLQRFYFFSGVAELFGGKKTREGLRLLLHAFFYGSRRLFYLFFFLKLIGYKIIGKKIRVAGY